MITKMTQTAIALIHAISTHTLEEGLDVKQTHELLSKLENTRIICQRPGFPDRQINSYDLVRPLHQISLLDVLEATGEHLDCNHPTTEEFYFNYGKAGQKLGVVNYMTRQYLANIKLVDL